MKYNLPKPYLSYSQINLWLKNKNQYRERYYQNKKSPETIETIYGKAIAKILEDPIEIAKNPTLSLVPRYAEPEFEIKIEVDGIPVLGFLDSYNPDTHSFYEYKTSHLNTWNDVSVSRHLQLPFYNFLIKEAHGKVDRVCHLIWIETRFKKQKIEYDGHELQANGRELELTGKIQVFKRTIPKWERDWVKQLLTTTAKEIDEDYKYYTRNQ